MNRNKMIVLSFDKNPSYLYHVTNSSTTPYELGDTEDDSGYGHFSCGVYCFVENIWRGAKFDEGCFHNRTSSDAYDKIKDYIRRTLSAK